MVTEETSLKIKLLSFVSAILVVFIHLPVTREIGFSMWFEDFFGSKVPLVAVPFFFVVSGYLLANRMESQEGGYYIQLKKRVRSLLMPYLFWCLAFGLQANLNSLLSNLACHYPLMRHIDLNPINIFGLDMTMNPPLPLWFLRALMLYVLVSPVLLRIARRQFSLTIFIGVLIAFNCMKNIYVSKEYTTLFSFTLAPVNILAFTFGMHFNSNPIYISKGVGRILLALGVLIFLVLSLRKFCEISLPQVLNAMLPLLAIAMVLAGVWMVCPAITLPTILQGQSFPIYLLHAVFVPYVLLVAQKFPVMLSWFGFLVNATVLLVCSLFSSLMLRHFSPKTATVLFGGR